MEKTNELDVLLYGVYFCDLIFTGLEEFPELGKEIYSKEFEILAGGCYYLAVALKRLRLKSAWGVDFGDDFFSQLILDEAKKEGLDPRFFVRHSGPVRRVTASLSYPHDRAFISYVDKIEEANLLDMVCQTHPTWLLIPGLAYGELWQACAAAAKECGSRIYMDCQSNPATLETPGLKEALGTLDIFSPNETEAMHLTGALSVDEALKVLSDLTPRVIVKLGAAGSITLEDGKIVRVPAIPIKVVDTTGAGDCFNCGFLYGFTNGKSLEDSLRCGNIAGGLMAAGRGSAAIPTAEQVEEYLKSGSQKSQS